MRDKPDTSGNKLVTIPTGTKVSLLEETGKNLTIAGATGKWSRVKWGNKTGWVFGGFLSNKKIESRSVKEIFYSIKEFAYMKNISLDSSKGSLGKLEGTPKKLSCSIDASGSCQLTSVKFEKQNLIFIGKSTGAATGDVSWECSLQKSKLLEYISSGGNELSAKCE